jgi:hypothetical protein
MDRPDPIPFWLDVRAFDFFNTRYPKVHEVYEGHFADGHLTQHAFDLAFDKIDLSKSPGSPLKFKFPHNKNLLDNKIQFYTLVDRRLAVLEQLGAYLFDIYQLNPDEFTRLMYNQKVHELWAPALVQSGIADPVLLKVKSEFRKKGKKARLVCMVSVTHTTCARLVYGNHLIEEQDHDEIPTATKLDIITPEITALMHGEFLENGPLTTSDVQGWEWILRALEHNKHFLKVCLGMNLIEPRPGPIVIKPGKHRHFFAMLGIHFVELHRLVQTNSGRLVVTPLGQGTSGNLDTFSRNSAIRSEMAFEVACINAGNVYGGTKYRELLHAYIRTAGDDCLDKYGDMTSTYKSRGVVITDYDENTQEFDFCSTRFTAVATWQTNIEKSFLVVVTGNPKTEVTQQRIMSWDLAFKNHPEYETYRNLITAYLAEEW